MESGNIVETFTYDGHNYSIKTIDNHDQSALESYCQQCERDGVINNKSIKALKMNRFSNEQWWAVYDTDTNIIVSVSGCHSIYEYEQNCWRVMFRLATLKKYRSKAGALCKDQRSCFGWGRLLPHQIKFCRQQGAKKIIFTTNSKKGGDINSIKQNRICEAIFEKLGMAKKIEETSIYNTTQNIWQVLIEDVYSKKELIL